MGLVHEHFLGLQAYSHTLRPLHPTTHSLSSLVFMAVGVFEGFGLPRTWATLKRGPDTVEVGEEEQEQYYSWAAFVWSLLLGRLLPRYGKISLILSQALRVAALFGD